MSYDSDETSPALSRPAELYTFVTPVATYRYTSHDLTVVYGGNTYVPIEISRPSIVVASANQADFAVKLPFDDAFSLAEAYSTPSYGITFMLQRVQLNGGFGIVMGTGKVAGFSTEGIWTSVRVPSIFQDTFDAPVPSVYFQGSCAHRLYDPRCTIDRNTAAFKVVTTLTAYDGKRTYTAASIGGHIDQWFRAGEIVVATTAERRYIVDQVGSLIELNAPIKAYSGGMSVTLYAGCDHTVSGLHGCYNKFANVAHFFGFPLIDPRRNFFAGKLVPPTVGGIKES